MSDVHSPEFYRLDALAFFDELSDDEQRRRLFARDVAVGIMNMGAALHTDGAPASVAINSDEDATKYRLYINPEKMSKFTREQRAGVVWHELNHVLHKHLSSDMDSEMPNERQRTMAEEIVCNDTPLHFGIDMPHNAPDDAERIITGERFVGKNTYPATTTEVYNMLQREMEQGNEDVQDAVDSGDAEDSCPSHGDADSNDDSGGGGAGGEDVQEADSSDDSGDGTTDSGGNGDSDGGQAEDELSSEELKEALGRLMDGMGRRGASGSWLKSIREQDESGVLQPGSNTDVGVGSSSAQVNVGYSGEDIVPDKWAEFLRKVDPRIDIRNANDYGMYASRQVVSDWRRVPSYMHSFDMSRFRLPALRPHNDFNDRGNMARPTVAVAIDQSGSIGAELARRVLSLAMAIPDDVADVILVVYAERAVLVDTKGKTRDEVTHRLLGANIGMGTDFNSVFYELKRRGVDMDSTTVINFTDGESDFSPSLLRQVSDWAMVDVMACRELDGAFNTLRSNTRLQWKRHIPMERWFAIHECSTEFLIVD